MASLHEQRGDRPGWKIRFRDCDNRQRALWLGKCSKRSANDTFRHVEELIRATQLSAGADPKTVAWVNALEDPRLSKRLFTLGLVEDENGNTSPKTVLAFMRAYIESRTDWRKPENYQRSVDLLKEYIGDDRPLRLLSLGDCQRWHRWMMDTTKNGDKPNGKALSPNTAGQHVKRCRQMMRQAMNDRLIERNPLEGIKVDLRSDTSKNRFIDAAMAAALLEACPDQQWRTLYALGRWGGLRCPSEVLRLRWSDIQWDRGRFKVTAPKTERYGKGERIVPLWPELAAELNTLFAIAGPGLNCSADSYVITRYRSTETNLRTTFHKIMDRAGVERFPKPFMALRASRRTELERSGRHANHVLNDWFGHSGAVAETHYLQTTEDDFAEAVKTPEAPSENEANRPQRRGNAGGNNSAGSGSAPRGQDGKKPIKNPPETFQDTSGVGIYTPQWIRTTNLRFRRPMLYPIELGVRCCDEA